MSRDGFGASTSTDALKQQVAVSASPGYTWGRSGNVSTNTYLLNDSVPSNKAGRTVSLINAKIEQVFVASENADTYDVAVYEHEGDEINLTLLNTYSVVATRSETFNDGVTAITTGRQLAVRISSGNGKNIVVGIQLKGAVV